MDVTHKELYYYSSCNQEHHLCLRVPEREKRQMLHVEGNSPPTRAERVLEDL